MVIKQDMTTPTAHGLDQGRSSSLLPTLALTSVSRGETVASLTGPTVALLNSPYRDLRHNPLLWNTFDRLGSKLRLFAHMMDCRAQPLRIDALTRAYPFEDPDAFVRSTTNTRQLKSMLLLGPSQHEIVLYLPELA